MSFAVPPDGRSQSWHRQAPNSRAVASPTPPTQGGYMGPVPAVCVSACSSGSMSAGRHAALIGHVDQYRQLISLVMAELTCSTIARRPFRFSRSGPGLHPTQSSTSARTGLTHRSHLCLVPKARSQNRCDQALRHTNCDFSAQLCSSGLTAPGPTRCSNSCPVATTDRAFLAQLLHHYEIPCTSGLDACHHRTASV